MQDSGPQRSWGASWWRGAWRGTGRVSLKRKPAQMGLLRDQQRDTHPGGGTAFSLGLWNQGLVQGWRLFSQLHCQEWRSSDSVGKAVLHVCRWQEEGLRDDRDSHSQVPARHCPGARGRCRQAEWASGSCDHCHLTTAGVSPMFFFSGGRRKGKGCVLPVDRRWPVQVQCLLAERFLQENTRATRWLRTVLV